MIMEVDKPPIDLFEERIRRRQPNDIGGIALTACLREAVAEGRIEPGEAADRLRAYSAAYTGKWQPEPPDGAA